MAALTYVVHSGMDEYGTHIVEYKKKSSFLKSADWWNYGGPHPDAWVEFYEVAGDGKSGRKLEWEDIFPDAF